MSVQTYPATDVVRPGTSAFTALLERIAAGAEERERERQPPHEVIGWVKEAGLGRLRVPIEEGGAGLSVRELFAMLVALAEADSNVAHILRTHFWFVEQQLQTADPEPGPAGSPWSTRRARRQRVQRAEQASVGLYFDTTMTPDRTARLPPQRHKVLLHRQHLLRLHAGLGSGAEATGSPAGGRPGRSPGVTSHDDWDGFGQRLTGTGTTQLDDVHVRTDEFFDLGEPDGAQPPGYQGAFLQLYLQAVTAGMLRSLRNDAVALVSRRTPELQPRRRTAGTRRRTRRSSRSSARSRRTRSPPRRSCCSPRSASRWRSTRSSTASQGHAAEAAQLAAAEAKVAIDQFSYATAARLFDVGGASAGQSSTTSTGTGGTCGRSRRTTRRSSRRRRSADHRAAAPRSPANAYF